MFLDYKSEQKKNEMLFDLIYCSYEDFIFLRMKIKQILFHSFILSMDL